MLLREKTRDEKAQMFHFQKRAIKIGFFNEMALEPIKAIFQKVLAKKVGTTLCTLSKMTGSLMVSNVNLNYGGQFLDPNQNYKTNTALINLI